MGRVLFVGDDWAADHHDIELQDAAGRRLGKAKLADGIAGIARLHAMIGENVDDETGPVEVTVGIETDRGPWVQALIASGYQVYPINPLQVARFRETERSSGGKSDAADAHTLADMVRTRRHTLKPMGGDSVQAETVKVLTRAHKTLIWERTRHLLRLQQMLREFFPAAVAAFDDLAAAEVLELLGKAPDPVSAARLSTAQITAALKRARRRDVAAKATAIQAGLRSTQLGQSPAVAGAYAATVRAQVAILTTLNTEITTLEGQVEAHFGQHPDAEIYLSQPGLGIVLGARVLAEFGDDPTRYINARARKNYAGTSPITRQSGKKKTVLARYVHNDRLIDALGRQAFAALRASPGARAHYDHLRARGVGHHAALRQMGNRLVGILHGCLKAGTTYDETPPGHTTSKIYKLLLDNRVHGMSTCTRASTCTGTTPSSRRTWSQESAADRCAIPACPPTRNKPQLSPDLPSDLRQIAALLDTKSHRVVLGVAVRSLMCRHSRFRACLLLSWSPTPGLQATSLRPSRTYGGFS